MAAAALAEGLIRSGGGGIAGFVHRLADFGSGFTGRGSSGIHAFSGGVGNRGAGLIRSGSGFANFFLRRRGFVLAAGEGQYGRNQQDRQFDVHGFPLHGRAK